MRFARAVLICALAALGACPAVAGEPAGPEVPPAGTPPPPLGRRLEGFELRDGRGRKHRLSDHRAAKVVVLAVLGTQCPLARHYAVRLQEISVRYAARGVSIVAIDANVQDSLAEIAEFERKHKLSFPVLKDATGSVAEQLSARRTPEAFVLDADRVVRYRGRIDDQFGVGYQRPKPTETYVTDAIEALLAGKEVRRPATEAVGCLIGRPPKPDPAGDVTYSRDIAPILNRRCVECHRAGDIAPFALTSYEEASGWAETMAEVVAQGRMPPWHADPKYGSFRNDPRLTDDEKRLIARWAALGAPQGDLKHLPPPPKFETGWRIGKPDQVVRITAKPFVVPAKGEVQYQYFIADPGFTEDKWIRAAECRPGAREVVHHIIAFVRPPGAGPPDDEHPGGRPLVIRNTIESDWLVATAPGARPMNLPDGLAKFVPAGSQFVFQVHYTPNGTEQQDVSEMGLIFADPKSVRKEVGTWRAANVRFAIPPGASDYRVHAHHTFAKDTLLLAMFPHMHLRGKSFRYEAVYPDGRREILLDVPRYDFAWQNSYILSAPKRMPSGTRLECTAAFDNSPANRSNPDPTATVRWGEQTWDEMMIGYFSMVLADQDLTKEPLTKRRSDAFRERYAHGQKPAADAELKKLAAAALDSPEAWERFAAALEKLVPQIDRVDWTEVEGGTLSVKLAAQSPLTRQLLGGRGISIPATDKALAQYAAGKRPVVHPTLGKAREADLRFMARLMSASLHVPVQVAGRQGTINFWSAERDAFPDPAVDLLVDLVARMAEGR